MDKIDIRDYLQDYNKETLKGKCKSCLKDVVWGRRALGQHKRSACTNVSTEEKKKFAKRTRQEVFDESSNDSSLFQNDSTSRSFTENKLSDEKVKEIDTKIANFFFRSGISFRLVESQAFKDLITTLNPAYQSIPKIDTLRGRLLDEQYEGSFKQLKEILEESSNLTLVSDGWTNVRGDHIVNFCIKSPNQKPFFYKSINTSGVRQDAQAVAQEIIAVIEELDAKKFCCVVTDNAAVMKAAWKLIEERFPHISANGCAAHGMNLLIKNILETTEYTKLMKDAEKVIKFVSNHHIVKAKYEEKRKLAKVPHTLSMAVVTRWFSRYTSLKSLNDSKYVLIQLVDENYEMLETINPKPLSVNVLKIIKATLFWDNLASLVNIIERPAKMIGK